MNKLKCIAIDDEPFALEIMGEDIQKIEFLELVGLFHNTEDAIPMIQNGAVDLLFLDIQMPTTTGMQFLRSLEEAPMVILTTAYEQYAIEGFELDVVDYLLKPIPFDRFTQAAQRAYTLYSLNNQQNKSSEEKQFLYVNAQYQKVRIDYEEILYVEGMKDYVKIFLQDKPKPILTRMNLKRMESLLTSDQFCRIHNSFIVSLDKITASLRTKVFFDNIEIPIGDKFIDQFRKQYQR
tara:strand:- start:110 stop:817 length:708 start_codon:yes stop_codon:yes gene_type:complete